MFVCVHACFMELCEDELEKKNQETNLGIFKFLGL